MSFLDDAKTKEILWEPKNTLADADAPIELISYFSLSEASSQDVKKRLEGSDIKQDKKDYYTKMLSMIPMWKFIIFSMHEFHGEAFSLDKGLSDSFTIMSTGTNVIRITFSGALQMYAEYDYRLDFLYIYDTFFRGYKLEDNDLELQVVVENTVFNFKPLGIQYFQDTHMPDFVRLTMTGLAYKYNITKETTAVVHGL